MKERAIAELARVKLFNDLMEANEEPRNGELPLLPLKLEYFRRYQFDVQRRYYSGRADEHARAAGQGKGWQRTSLALSYVAAIVAGLAVFKLAVYLRILPPWLEGIVKRGNGVSG